MRRGAKKAAISFILLGTAVPAMADLEVADADDIIIACERLMADYAIYRDHMDADAWANTFAEDGELVLGSGSHRGREAIRQSITSRPRPATVWFAKSTRGAGRTVVFSAPWRPSKPPSRYASSIRPTWISRFFSRRTRGSISSVTSSNGR